MYTAIEEKQEYLQAFQYTLTFVFNFSSYDNIVKLQCHIDYIKVKAS